MKTKKEKTEKQYKIRRPRKSGPEGGLGHTLYVFFLIFIGSVASVCLCYGLAVSCTQLSDRSRGPGGSETHKQTESCANSDSYETLYFENETEKLTPEDGNELPLHFHTFEVKTIRLCLQR